jgi:uncharacterized protein YecT (DUF1311 family)
MRHELDENSASIAPMKTLLTLLICSLLVYPCLAQNQQEMNREAELRAARADKKLNLVYKKLLPTMDEDGQKLLRESQRAWVVFRDAEAALAADQARGGSMAPMLFAGTLARLSEARAKELESYLAEGDAKPEEQAPQPSPHPSNKAGAKSAKEAARRFFDAYKSHDREAAQVVAVERALNKLVWSNDAGDNPTLKLMNDTVIYYEGGSIALSLKKTSAGNWMVMDVESTAD